MSLLYSSHWQPAVGGCIDENVASDTSAGFKWEGLNAIISRTATMDADDLCSFPRMVVAVTNPLPSSPAAGGCMDEFVASNRWDGFKWGGLKAIIPSNSRTATMDADDQFSFLRMAMAVSNPLPSSPAAVGCVDIFACYWLIW